MHDSLPGQRPDRLAGALLTFRVLDVDCPADRAAWVACWQRWPGREIMCHPAYAQLFAQTGDRVLAICAETANGGGILYPLILRSLKQLPWTDDQQVGCDLTSPYGYGGPFAWNVPSEAADEFWDTFDRWAREQQAVSLFSRRSLFPEQVLPFRGREVPWLLNVVRRLDLPLSAIWKDYAHKVRTNIRRAQRFGLRVEWDSTGARLDAFRSVYQETMQRRQADGQYFFPRRFFEHMLEQLEGQFIFCHIFDGEELISTELLLLSADHVYSFLGGTRTAALALRPNELLKHSVVEWAAEQGKRTYVLGGGYRPDDGIFRYKRAFAPKDLAMFHVGQRILDADSAATLVEQRRRWEATRRSTWTPRPDYFPPYRA